MCLSRPYHLKFFKGCLTQILLGPFLNTLSHVSPTLQELSVAIKNCANSIQELLYDVWSLRFDGQNILFQTLFLEFSFSLSLPSDKHDQASGYLVHLKLYTRANIAKVWFLLFMVVKSISDHFSSYTSSIKFSIKNQKCRKNLVKYLMKTLSKTVLPKDTYTLYYCTKASALQINIPLPVTMNRKIKKL